MRVAFLSTILHYPWGGADRLWTAAAAAALSDGHNVLLAVAPAVAEHGQIAALVQRGARLHRRQGFTLHNGLRASLRQRFLHWIRSASSLPAALDSFRPDFVFISQGGAFDLLVEHGLTDWLRAARCPFALICQSNGDDGALSPADRHVATDLARLAHRFVFVSTHNRSLAERQLGTPLSNAVVVQNPVELGFPTPLPWPADITARLAVVARLDNRTKGLDTLLDALADALGREPGWTLDLFGRGPDEATLRNQTDALGFADRVQFRGFSKDLLSVWQQHHLLLLPSRREGCSLAMLEALSCGRPVLATPAGGTADWVVPGCNGFIAPGFDAAALAATLRTAWAVRASWPALGAAAGQIAARLDPVPGRTLLSLAS